MWTVRRGVAAVVVLVGWALIWIACLGADGEPEMMTAEELFPFKRAPYSPLKFQIGLPQFMQGGDFTGDGNIDLLIVTANYELESSRWRMQLVLLEGDGTGRFRSPCVLYEVEVRLVEGELAGLGGIASGDFDLDGYCDFAAVDVVNGGVQVFWNERTGDFSTTFVEGPEGFMPSAVVSADLDGNGQPELAVLDPLHGWIHVFSKVEGERAFAHSASARVPTGYLPLWMYAGAFTDEATERLVVLGYQSDSPQGKPVLCITMWSMPTGMLTLTSSIYVGEGAPIEPPVFAIGDYDGDGHLDILVVRNQTIWALWGNERGEFRLEPIYPALDLLIVQLLLVDIDRDGCYNLISLGGATNRVWASTGCYSKEEYMIPVKVSRPPRCAVVDDLDGDGVSDLVVATYMIPEMLDWTYLEIFLGKEVRQNAER